jgi:hypothetical protein
MSKEDRVGQSKIEELEQGILQYLGGENSPQKRAFGHTARSYEIDAEGAKTGRSQTRNRIANSREINERMSDPAYRAEWININLKLPTWRNVITQGITDPYVQLLTFAQKLVDINNLAEGRKQQPPLQSGK